MYVFQADTYCDDCGAAMVARLEGETLAERLERLQPFTSSTRYALTEDDVRYDFETGSHRYALTDTGDSDDYPQSAPEGETDSPDHCASGADCLAAIDLSAYGLEDGAELYGAESRRAGALLGDELTPHGVEYLLELLGETRTPYQRALHALWRETFGGYIENALTRSEPRTSIRATMGGSMWRNGCTWS